MKAYSYSEKGHIWVQVPVRDHRGRLIEMCSKCRAEKPLGRSPRHCAIPAQKPVFGNPKDIIRSTLPLL